MIMSKKDKKEQKNEVKNEGLQELEAKVAELEQAKTELEEQKAELEDKNLRMMAEFDNFRRRTNKEKLELLDTAGERIFKEMLPLIDDFERAVEAMDKTDDILITALLLKFAQINGVDLSGQSEIYELLGIDSIAVKYYGGQLQHSGIAAQSSVTMRHITK